MKTHIKIGFSFACLLVTQIAFANPASFCCEDANWQQKMLDAYNTRTDHTNFSYPPGEFRKKCTNTRYDGHAMSSYCQDITGRTSYFPSYVTVGYHYNDIYADENGFLKHGAITVDE